MARIEIEVNDPVKFAEVLYYNFAETWQKNRNTAMPAWENLEGDGRKLWIDTSIRLLSSYMRANLLL